MFPLMKSPDPAKPSEDLDITCNEPINEQPTEAGSPKGAMQTRSLRTPSGALSHTHPSFTVTSGVVLWGHIIAMYHGSQPGAFFTNNAASAPEPALGGTIIQHTHSYRSAARVGNWKVRRYLSNWREVDGLSDGGLEHAGWVICHEDVDAMEVLRRASGIGEFGNGISHWNAHDDEEVLCIGRYDWECPGEEEKFEEEFQAWAEPAIGPVVPDGPYRPKSNVTSRGYFAVLDAEEWGLDFLRAYKRDCNDAVIDEEFTPVERVFEKVDGKRVGAYVRMPGGEYEYGWLIFSGKKHARFDADELIAIIYDGYSELLEGPSHGVEPEP
ncbi:hypothetical protein MFIFM68171_02550 [Madurella fahalii]|uniref:Uncharacterized protein n=1 Tax=Madurella fahalii TaxID=1157608 RepID=A0ABQ0G3M1_9PEZI